MSDLRDKVADLMSAVGMNGTTNEDVADAIMELIGREFAPDFNKQQATIAKLTEHLTTVIARYDEYRADEYDVGLHGVDDAIEKARAALAQTAKGETDVRA